MFHMRKKKLTLIYHAQTPAKTYPDLSCTPLKNFNPEMCTVRLKNLIPENVYCTPAKFDP
jgi:hypothetical protein